MIGKEENAMAFYRACPFCRCNLDPGEICDCRERAQYIRQEATQQHARDQTRRAGAVRRITVGELGNGSAPRAALPRR